MAFDQPTRNRLQRFVSDVRDLLIEEFTRQLQNDYGLDPKSGVVAAVDSLRHLGDAQRETAQILRDTMAHYLAGERVDVRAVLDRIVREQSFTVLNRLAALRMAEARGLLIESVGAGYQSQGFQLYARLVGTGLGETGEAYRTYLFSIFDELAQDLPGLFDRYSPQGRLFPREPVLLQLLGLVNEADVAVLWSEDETIGWVFQYFNSREERKRMRDESQAPRNSRELAVRNQFFTPRYVVEYLVDNTLGRLWFDATGGETTLRETCKYLLVRPDEQPVPIAKVRDPRTLKLLDPACGSMHFGLYAFDLFLAIYREAWAWEERHGTGSLDVSALPDADFKPLCETYASEATFLRDVPRLIIEHNLYGVDIDVRATQIASLALWLRAQRAWHEAGVKDVERPVVGRGHVVAATAPPAEPELRGEFERHLTRLDAELFEKTLQMLRCLPELGLLLCSERELPYLIHSIYGEHGEMFEKADEERWKEAEKRLRAELNEFAQATQSTYQGRLFSGDALEGLRIIDMTREQYDVVVMNPPYGEPTRATKAYLEENLANSKGNILTHFIERAVQLVRPGGRIGAIVSRTCFFLGSFADFRRLVLEKSLSLESLADLGGGVLDAMVETAAVTWKKECGGKRTALFFRSLVSQNKPENLLESIRLANRGVGGPDYFRRRTVQFSIFEDCPYVYWIDESVARKLSQHPTIDPVACSIRVGLQTGDDYRFLRLWWEVKDEDIIVPRGSPSSDDVLQACVRASTQGQKWAWYSKTEAASPFLSSINLCVNWEDDGSEIKSFVDGSGKLRSRPQNSDFYFRSGYSYMLRSSRIVPYIVPRGVIPTAGRSQVYPAKEQSEAWMLALLASNIATAVARFRGENFWQPKLQNSMVSAIPFLKPESKDVAEAVSVISTVRAQMAARFKEDETEILFVAPAISTDGTGTAINRETLVGRQLDTRISEICDLTSVEFDALQRDHREALSSRTVRHDLEEDSESNLEEEIDTADTGVDLKSAQLSWSVGVAFGRFDWRLATGERMLLPEPDPFEPLPARSPGMLPDDAESFHAGAGILVDDPGNPHDLPHVVEEVLEKVDIAVPGNVREWLRRDFFAFHLQRYSKNRRRAPIYWPLSTSSCSYTLWVYYPSLTDQTLYTVVNDFVEPKLKQAATQVASLSAKGKARSTKEEQQFEEAQSLEDELTDLHDTLLKIAPTYHPDQDDGVEITAAPLWPLFRHKPWQKLLKETWTKLEKGDYDWAHLALHYWPDRVREKCKTDKSLAIAHGLEDLYVEPEIQARKTRTRRQ